MRILVSGGIGFFGINVVRYLAGQLLGAQIVAAYMSEPDDQVRRFLAPYAERVRLVRLDVADRAGMIRLVRDEQISHFVHAGAITPGPDREKREPTHIVDVNLGGMINALEAAIACPSVERLLLVSSSGVYGAPEGDPFQPQREEGPLQVIGLYAIAKYSAELLGRRYSQLSGKPITAARFPAMYGPMERPTRSRQNMSMPQQLLNALRAGRHLRLAGPERSSDWTHILDAAEGVRALLRAPKWNHAVYNVSCGHASTFRELAEACGRHGLDFEWVEDASHADIAMQATQVRAPMDISKLKADAGFQPRFDLAAGVADLVAFQDR